MKKVRRTEKLDITFGADRYAIGWAFDVIDAFRTPLDIQLSTLVDREKSKAKRAQDPGADPVYRHVWTRGVPPTLAFEQGHVFYEPHGPRFMRWGDALAILRRVAQVSAAAPDSIGSGDGWVEFRLWQVRDAQLGESVQHRCSQAAFAQFLRNGALPG
ncbi:MAG: hypothetical protein WAS21_27970 [Geminicoccaceae bacterium]